MLTMRKLLAYLIGGIVMFVALTGVVFVAGMRAKAPPVLNTVRRLGRATKSLPLRSAGQPGAYASVVYHVGRSSGRPYETPVGAVPTGDGFAIALPYGLNTDWLQNVLASGSARIMNEGKAYRVERPEVVALTVADHYFSAGDQRAHRLFGVEHCLRVWCIDDVSAQA